MEGAFAPQCRNTKLRKHKGCIHTRTNKHTHTCTTLYNHPASRKWVKYSTVKLVELT